MSSKSAEPGVKSPRNSLGLTCLNAGCGRHYWKDWVNLDFHESRYVRYCDLRRGIPYPDNIFDVVYSSHVIEHFSYKAGQKFVRDLFRVLSPGGTIRLLTPDLERIATEYLENLKAWDQDKSDINRRRYEWIMLEMFDQMTRETSGGLMAEKIQAGDVCPDYVVYCTGDELRGQLYAGEKSSLPEAANDSLVSALFYRLPPFCQNILREMFYFVRKVEAKVPFAVPFRESGELHKWYYDRVSLEHLLSQTGFVDFKVVDYKTSRVFGWAEMNLDISAFGDAPRKPDSIIVEATKPKVSL